MVSGKARPFVPKTWRDKVTAMFHSLSHPGPKKIAEKVASRYYWPSLGSDVAQWVKSCPGCQASKSSRTIVPPLDKKPIKYGRFKSLQIDIVGPLVSSEFSWVQLQQFSSARGQFSRTWLIFDSPKWTFRRSKRVKTTVYSELCTDGENINPL